MASWCFGPFCLSCMGRNAISPFPPARMGLNAWLPACPWVVSLPPPPLYPGVPQMFGYIEAFSLSFFPGKAATGDLMGFVGFYFIFDFMFFC